MYNALKLVQLQEWAIKLSIFIRSYLEACARLGREPLPGEAGSDDD